MNSPQHKMCFVISTQCTDSSAPVVERVVSAQMFRTCVTNVFNTQMFCLTDGKGWKPKVHEEPRRVQ